jgi:hypothetical protein
MLFWIYHIIILLIYTNLGGFLDLTSLQVESLHPL